MKWRGGFGLLFSAGVQSPVDLVEGEAWEGFVVVERLDDVIAVRPDVVWVVAVVADGVGETDLVEPTDRHALAVVGGFEELSDQRVE